VVGNTAQRYISVASAFENTTFVGFEHSGERFDNSPRRYPPFDQAVTIPKLCRENYGRIHVGRSVQPAGDEKFETGFFPSPTQSVAAQPKSAVTLRIVEERVLRIAED